MSHTSNRLLERLEAIGLSLASTGRGVALLGLGSVGVELDRLDEYSDLDFFAVVQPGTKPGFIEDLGWLESVYPLAYVFRNTPDGYKLLFEDGIYCEFAVFEPSELAEIPFAEARIVWKAEGVSDSIRLPVKPAAASPRSLEWSLGEALTCLYVGLARWRRGEKLSAQRFIQCYAVDRLMEIAGQTEPPSPARTDPFALDRRFEQRFQKLAADLPHFMQGYERSPESALAILAFLESRLAVNPALARQIRQLAAG